MPKPPVRPPTKQTPAPVKPVKPVVVKPVKPIVSPPVAPPAPVVWTRLDLSANCTTFMTNVLANRAEARISSFDINGDNIQSVTYVTYVSIVPPLGKWQEQRSIDGGLTYRNTAVQLEQTRTGLNPALTINLTLDGAVGPATFMRYFKL